MELQGMVRRGATLSVRNVRLLDRSQIRGKTMETNAAGFYVFYGAEPDYYTNVSGTTNYFNGSLVLTDSSGNIKVSQVAWENGKLNKGSFPSGTVLEDPRAYFNPRTMSVPTTYTVSGDITVTIPSGQLQNFVF